MYLVFLLLGMLLYIFFWTADGLLMEYSMNQLKSQKRSSVNANRKLTRILINLLESSIRCIYVDSTD